MKKLALIVLTISSLIVLSCSKEETTVKTRAELLTAKDWMMTAAIITMNIGGKDSSIDMYSTMPACEKDDLFKFETSKVITQKCGALKCNPTDPNSISSGIWTLIDESNPLRIIDGDTTDFNILTLNTTTLKMQTGVPGSTQTITFTGQ